MAYSRQPNVTIAGRGLTQNPAPLPVAPAGIIQVGYDSNIATTTSLGIIQVGSGLAVTPAGVLSATGGGGGSLINVHLTSANYTATANDYYIGATTGGITITFPTGVTGKVYIVKNQASSGNITVKGTGQNIDQSGDKSLGGNASIVVVFDGSRWNVIQ
jgi:hypothetical protein